MNNTADPAADREDQPELGTEARYALEGLVHGWGEAYHIEVTPENGWRAKRRDDLGGWITAAGPDELWTAMLADYELKHVPRDLPGGEG